MKNKNDFLLGRLYEVNAIEGKTYYILIEKVVEEPYPRVYYSTLGDKGIGSIPVTTLLIPCNGKRYRHIEYD